MIRIQSRLENLIGQGLVQGGGTNTLRPPVASGGTRHEENRIRTHVQNCGIKHGLHLGGDRAVSINLLPRELRLFSTIVNLDMTVFENQMLSL